MTCSPRSRRSRGGRSPACATTSPTATSTPPTPSCRQPSTKTSPTSNTLSKPWRVHCRKKTLTRAREQHNQARSRLPTCDQRLHAGRRPWSPRQAEEALRDDVALDLRGAPKRGISRPAAACQPPRDHRCRALRLGGGASEVRLDRHRLDHGQLAMAQRKPDALRHASTIMNPAEAASSGGTGDCGGYPAGRRKLSHGGRDPHPEAGCAADSAPSRSRLDRWRERASLICV